MKNTIDASNVIAMRRLDLLRSIKQRLKQSRLDLKENIIVESIEKMDNMEFLTGTEKITKKINPHLEFNEIVKDNPKIIENIVDRLQSRL